MKKIENGFCDCYYLSADGKVYDSQKGEYKERDSQNSFTLKTKDGKRKKIALKVLYSMVYNRTYCEDDIADLEGEKWKEVENTGHMYFVSNMGRIKSLKGYKAIILKQTVSRNGYVRVDIIEDGKRVTKLVHRLVGIAFLPNPLDVYMQLHHKDHDKRNNCSDNLEWLSIAEHKRKHEERSTIDAKL